MLSYQVETTHLHLAPPLPTTSLVEQFLLAFVNIVLQGVREFFIDPKMCSVQKKDCRPLAVEVVSLLADFTLNCPPEGAYCHPKERSVRGWVCPITSCFDSVRKSHVHLTLLQWLEHGSVGQVSFHE